MRKSNNTLWNFDGIHNREKLASLQANFSQIFIIIRFIIDFFPKK